MKSIDLRNSTDYVEIIVYENNNEGLEFVDNIRKELRENIIGFIKRGLFPEVGDEIEIYEQVIDNTSDRYIIQFNITRIDPKLSFIEGKLVLEVYVFGDIMDTINEGSEEKVSLESYLENTRKDKDCTLLEWKTVEKKS